MNSEDRTQRRKEDDRKYYLNMTPEQREKRKIYQRDYMRQRRAAQKAAKSPVQPVSESTAPMTSSKPQERVQRRSVRSAEPTVKAQDLESYEELSTHKAKALQRVWRKEVSEYLLDCLTAPESPLTGAGMRTSKMLCFYFNLGEKLNRIVE